MNRAALAITHSVAPLWSQAGNAAMWAWNPASSARTRSSDRAYAVSSHGAHLSALLRTERPNLADLSVAIVARHPDIAEQHVRPLAS